MAQTVDELLETKPDIVVEVASIEAVQNTLIKVLKHGIPFVALSIGAFVDAAFYEKAKQTARDHNTRIYFSSGAIGGFDVMRTIAFDRRSTGGADFDKRGIDIQRHACIQSGSARLRRKKGCCLRALHQRRFPCCRE